MNEKNGEYHGSGQLKVRYEFCYLILKFRPFIEPDHVIRLKEKKTSVSE